MANTKNDGGHTMSVLIYPGEIKPAPLQYGMIVSTMMEGMRKGLNQQQAMGYAVAKLEEYHDIQIEHCRYVLRTQQEVWK